MDAAVVKVQLPAGAAFVAAIVDAAAKYAARRGFSSGAETTFVAMVKQAATAVDSAGAATISFTASELTDRVESEIRGVGATQSLSNNSTASLNQLGQSCLSCSVDADKVSVAFSLAT